MKAGFGLRRRSVVGSSLLAIAIAVAPGAASAQTAATGTVGTPPGEAQAPDQPVTPPEANSAESATTPGSAGSAQEIVVTGSRLARSTFDTPSPVTVLGAQDLQRLQITNIGAGIAQLPAFRPSNNPTTNGFGSFNVGAQIVNLRGLGVTRNLVLVDGRRFAPSTREGSVDLNFIPSILVARTEVVTGGASAAYGSDALAGVVNVILDKRLQGFKAQADMGISDKGDGRNPHLGLAFGSELGGGAGHFVIGGEYSDQKGIGNCFTRDWCKPGAVVTNTGYNARNAQGVVVGNGLPQYIRSNDNAGFFMTPDGVVSRFNNPAGVGNAIANSQNANDGNGAITFAPDGTPRPAIAGTTGFGISQVGGNPIYPTYTDSNLVTPVERYSVFAHADYDFSDTISGFVEGSYGHVDGSVFQAAYFSSSLPIFADNPYIPAALRAQVPAPAGPVSTVRPATAAFNLGKVFDDLARGFSRSKADTYRGTAGLNGKLSDRFSWDAYYQYGRTDRLQTVDNNLVLGDPAQPLTTASGQANSNARFFYALDAVTDPATGNPICRALLSTNAAIRTAAAGCVPINLFGAGNVTDAGKDYIYAQLRENIKLQQHVAAANLRGATGDLLAGPLSFAIGAEYRVDKIDVTHDDLSNLYAYFQNFGSDYNGKTEVVEGYLEAELPILKDVPGFHSLTLNGAIRQAHYKISGFGSYLRTASRNSFDATTWKLSLNWEPAEWLRLRGTQSRDVRAPNFADLFLASASSFTPVTNPFPGAVQGAPPSIVNGGQVSLRPEKADTTTLGIVLDPKGGFLSGLRVSVDAYRIKIKDYIGSAPGGAQFLVDRCFAGVAESCAFIDRDAATGRITTIRNVTLNLDEILTKGIDFEADYRIPLAGEDQLLLRGIATYVDTLKTTSLGDVVDRAGQTGNSVGLAAPKWIVNGTVTYASPRWSFTVQGRYIDSGTYDSQRIGPDDSRYDPTLLNSISDNHVDSRFYVNLFGSIFAGENKQYEFFASVNNLFDKDPPPAPETQFYTNPIYFDTIGRYYRAGMRVKF